MKKHLLIVPLLLISITVIAFQKQIRGWFITEKALNKEINVSIKSDSIYNSSAYNEALAQVHIIITKVKGSKEITVWKKDFANMQLKQYERNEKSFSARLHIPVINSKEKLKVSYIIIYNSNGRILELSDTKQIDKKQEQKLEIDI